MAKGVWGIDVSKYSAKAVRLVPTGSGLAMTHIDVVTYEGVEEGNTENQEQAIKNALLDLRDRNKIAGEPVILSLPGHSTFNRLIKLPPVDESKVSEIIKYEAQSQIPFNIDEVIWDYQLIQRDYGPGEEREVILFAIKKDIVEQFLSNIAEVGLNIDAVQFGPVALYNFLVKDQEVGKAAVAMDMGGDNTDLVVIDDAKFWIRNLPITGNDITKALQKTFNIPFAEAEKLKIKAGQSQQAQKIFNAIQPVLRDLVGEIHRSIGYYKSISKSIKFDKIILLGNATKTINFQKFVSQSLQMPAMRVQKLNAINTDGVDATALNNHLSTAGTAIGLALQGLGDSRNSINLLPAIYRRKKELKKKQPWIIGAAAVLYILVGLMFAMAHGDVSKLETTYGSGDRAQKRFMDLKSKYDAAKQIDPIRAPLDTICSMSTERDLLLKVFDEINPNLTDNKVKGKDNEKIWVVDWHFEEVLYKDEKPPEKETTSGTVRQPTIEELLVYPTRRTLIVSIQVCIVKRDDGSQDEGRKFILKQLFNWDPAMNKKADDNRRNCVIEAFGLVADPKARNHWEASPDSGDLERPVPKDVKLDETSSEPKAFWRYTLTLSIPVTKKERDSLKSGKPDEKSGDKPK